MEAKYSHNGRKSIILKKELILCQFQKGLIKMERKIKDYSKYNGKRIKVIAVNNQVFHGFVSGVDTPEDSEDNQFWLDLEEVDNPMFGPDDIMTIAESEIKEITIIDK
nr:hypothetical protein [Ligilactobacillus pabuli]